jgi:hypothetical protein
MQKPSNPLTKLPPVWRWAFLCSITANLTLLSIWKIETIRGNYLDYSVRAEICLAVWWITSYFQFIAPPYIFFVHRKISWIAVIGWILAVLTIFALFTPAFPPPMYT